MIYDFYISTTNKNANDTFYDFIITIPDNIEIKPTETTKIKIVDLSIMNMMYNISSFRKNNTFRVRNYGVISTLTIPDGNYSATTFRDTVNGLIASSGLVMNFYPEIQKFTFTCSDSNPAHTQLIPDNLCDYFGIFNEISIGTTPVYSTRCINMLNYQKIILTSSFTPSGQQNHNLTNKFSSISSPNCILAWIDKDSAPYITIKYYNYENTSTEIADKNIKSIQFQLMNEFSELIYEAPACQFHMQIIVEDDKNIWLNKFYKLLSDMYYSLLSLYFKK